jgi:hypothetical protein
MDEIKINNDETDISDIEIPKDKDDPIRIIRTRDFDDKDLIIIATAIIGIVSLLILQDPSIVITSVLSGLFGMATGKKL